MTLSRRTYLSLLGTTGTLAVAGCMAGEVNRTPYDAPTVSAPHSLNSFLSNANKYDGTALDLTDRDEVEVDVGTESNGGFLGFAPVAVQISPGTTVVWKWTGEGGAHNVVAKSNEFRSGNPIASDGTTFSHTFSETGVYQYFCTPHRRNGMKGAVIVE